jgi:arylsulfatase A-like enzyme
MRASNPCRLRALVSTLIALWLGGCSPGGPDAPASRIVLITFDTLRADALDARRMPRTWALAERGLRFDHFYSASSATQPTHATLFTGLQPWEHGVARNGMVLDARYDTVAERLQAAGFRTAAVVASFALERRFALDQGFDHYDQVFEHMLVRGQWQGEPVEGRRFYGLGGPVVARALERLDTLGGRRQFLWLHLFDPHEPYGDAAGGQIAYPSRIRQLASTGELERGHLRYARRLYDADLRQLDAALAPFYDRVLSEAEEVETHWVITSDHGESFGEDGSVTHGYRVSPEQVHVPLVIVSPRIRPGVRSDVAGSRDVARTLLGLAGVDAGDLPGRDLLAPVPPGDGAAFGMTGQFGREPELRTDGREVDASAPRFFAAGPGALLTGDAQNVFEDDREDRPVEAPRAAAARERFAEFDRARRARSAADGEDAGVLQDEETEAALRALGYFD